MSTHFRTTLAVLLTSTIMATAQDAPAPADPAPAPKPAGPGAMSEKVAADLLKTLEVLQTQLGSAKGKQSGGALAALLAASLSPEKAYDLFLDCKKKVDFEDKGKTSKDFTDWKTSKDQRTTSFHSPFYKEVLQQQAQWLVLTIQATSATTEAAYGAVVAKIPAYFDNLSDSIKKMGPMRGELDHDVVTDTVFGKFYKLDITLDKSQVWSYKPLNMDAVYDTVVLPYYRAKKDPANVTAAWKKRMAVEEKIITIAKNDDKADPNNNAEEAVILMATEKLPMMEWGMLKDSAQMINETTGANALLEHIKKHLGHKDAAKWIDELARMAKHEVVEPTTIEGNFNGGGGGGERRAGPQNKRGR